MKIQAKQVFTLAGESSKGVYFMEVCEKRTDVYLQPKNSYRRSVAQFYGEDHRAMALRFVQVEIKFHDGSGVTHDRRTKIADGGRSLEDDRERPARA